ncbi:MAG: tRNA (guanine(10)-N(2))-dimethyltransferase [Candidatus Bathyarchaeota archaeon]|nr:tRNA (guanine(10)-N(2))-dimethyltransferase [Candidatus Bathyarchaeota archaeon]
MSFDFPTETITEGKVKVVVPKLSAYVKKPWEYAPSKAPVFYNPTMELNRDLAVLALQAHQKLLGREVSVCEPLTGCGLRGVRFAVEVEGVRRVFLNDIKPEAARLASFNAELNNVEDRVEVANEDANLFLSRNAAPRKRFDFVDVDPFGPPVPYLDAAIRALRNGGLLALTATDMAPLCGVHARACLRKYGGQPLRTEYCHELAVRLLIGCLTMMAAKHAIGVEVLFSHSVDHYVRAYAVVNYGARLADKSIQQMGYILHCFSCFHRETVSGITSPLKHVCPSCGAKLSVAGPLWLGKIADKNFCSLMEREAEGRSLRQEKRLLKMVSLVQNEAEAPISYYAVDKICDKLNLPIPALKKVIGKLKKEGFQAVQTHFNSRGFRTDAPASIVREIVTKLTA